MNKGLESFYELKKVILDLFVNVGDCKEQLDTIETELKRLEEIDNPKITGVLSTDKALEEFLLWRCPNIKAKLEKQDEILRIIKSFNCYTVEEIQGQWYLMMGTIVVKSPKIPISEETAMMLKEWLK